MENNNKVKFVKMEATGNDFILLNGNINKKFVESVALNEKIKGICNRNFGVGSDGLMFTSPSEIADIKMNYYNSDGSIAELCGNGIRCFAKFVFEEESIGKKELEIETLAGTKRVILNFSNNKITDISVNIGEPVFKTKMIPVNTDKQNEGLFQDSIDINGMRVEIFSLRIGVPHSVVFIDDINGIDLESSGEIIENHALFPERTNVNFVKIIDKNNINIYTWERGAGRTLSCGTGACASVLVGKMKNLLADIVNVKAEGGNLKVEIRGNNEIFLTGNAKTVFRGVFNP